MKYLTDRDVASRLGVGWQYVQDRCRDRQWPHLRIGRLYRFTERHVEQIEALVEVQPETAPDSGWGVKSRSAS